MTCVMDILHQFSDMSRQKVSEECVWCSRRKSLIAWRGSCCKCPIFVRDMGKYLGVPLSGRIQRMKYYQYLMEHVSSKMARWKTNYHSFVGRIMLAKSVIEAMLIYPMMKQAMMKFIVCKIALYVGVRLRREYTMQSNGIWSLNIKMLEG